MSDDHELIGTLHLLSKDLHSPQPTLTGGGGDVAIAQPFILPITHSGVRPVHQIDDPLRTITGANRGELALVEPCLEEAELFEIDVLYRMLGYRELARAMSLDDHGEVYNFAGNATEITKQIGNAVPCRTAQALVTALMADVASSRRNSA